MSDGLLRGLARRAMGVEAALRPRRTVPSLAAEQTSDAHAVGEAAPMLVAREHATRRLDRAADTAAQSTPGPRKMPVRPVDPGDVRRTRQEGAPGDRSSSSDAAPAEAAANVAAALADPSPLATAPSPNAQHAEASAHARALAAAPDAAMRYAAAAPAARPFTMPTALLPPAASMSRRSPPPGAAPASRRPSGGADTATPTEVHVSIGRVELTAVAPPASGRPRPRRPAADPHSLADYLRAGGSGGTGGKGSA